MQQGGRLPNSPPVGCKLITRMLHTQVCVLIELVLLVGGPWPVAGQPKLTPSRCARLTGLGRGYCMQFVSAKDSYNKYKSASDWARFATDTCALRAVCAARVAACAACVQGACSLLGNAAWLGTRHCRVWSQQRSRKATYCCSGDVGRAMLPLREASPHPCGRRPSTHAPTPTQCAYAPPHRPVLRHHGAVLE